MNSRSQSTVDTAGPGHAFTLQLSTQRPNDAVDASL